MPNFTSMVGSSVQVFYRKNGDIESIFGVEEEASDEFIVIKNNIDDTITQIEIDNIVDVILP